MAATSIITAKFLPGFTGMVSAGTSTPRMRITSLSSPMRSYTFERAHAAGIQMVVWTIDTADLMLKYMALGVDYLNTNRPDLLIELKKKKFIEK